MFKQFIGFGGTIIALVLAGLIVSAPASAEKGGKKKAAEDLVCVECVGLEELEANSVDSSKIIDHSVDESDLNFDPASQVELDGHTADTNAHHVPTVDTDTSAATECLAGEVLLGGGGCLAVTSLAETLFARRTLFATSSLHSGNLGGLAGADAICTDLANNNSDSIVPEGDYIAILSTSSVDASSRVGASLGPVVASDGTLIAENVAALFAARYEVVTVGFENSFLLFDPLLNPILLDETGADAMATSSLVRTGSSTLGVKWSDDPTLLCSNWTSAATDKDSKGVGVVYERDSGWINGSGSGVKCGWDVHLYCLSK